MAVISNTAVQSVCPAIQTKSTYPVQRTNDCRPTCSVNRSILPIENVSSVWLINSKQTFTLLLVYYSTLIIYICSYFLYKLIPTFQKCFSFWGTVPQTPTGALPLDPTTGLPSPRPPDLGPPVKNSQRRPCWYESIEHYKSRLRIAGSTGFTINVRDKKRVNAC